VNQKWLGILARLLFTFGVEDELACGRYSVRASGFRYLFFQYYHNEGLIILLKNGKRTCQDEMCNKLIFQGYERGILA